MPFETLNTALWMGIAPEHPSYAVLGALKAVALGPVWLLPPLVGALWLLGGRLDREAAVSAAVTACFAMLIAHFTSVLIDHPRPFILGMAPNWLAHDADSSFPSDHATLFFGLATAFWLFPVPRLSWLAPWLAVGGLAVGWARIALGVHWPFDIVGAVLIGGASGLAVRVGLRRFVLLLTAIGEGFRRRLSILSSLDRRDDAAGAGDAHPSG